MSSHCADTPVVPITAVEVLHPWGAGNLRDGQNTVFLHEGGREAAAAAPDQSMVPLGCRSSIIIPPTAGPAELQEQGRGWQVKKCMKKAFRHES